MLAVQTVDLTLDDCEWLPLFSLLLWLGAGSRNASNIQFDVHVISLL